MGLTSYRAARGSGGVACGCWFAIIGGRFAKYSARVSVDGIIFVSRFSRTYAPGATTVEEFVITYGKPMVEFLVEQFIAKQLVKSCEYNDVPARDCIMEGRVSYSEKDRRVWQPSPTASHRRCMYVAVLTDSSFSHALSLAESSKVLIKSNQSWNFASFSFLLPSFLPSFSPPFPSWSVKQLLHHPKQNNHSKTPSNFWSIPAETTAVPTHATLTSSENPTIQSGRTMTMAC